MNFYEYVIKKYKSKVKDTVLEELRKIFYLEIIIEEDYEYWLNKIELREKAMEKFGFISNDYENIKNEGKIKENIDMITYGYWCRSITACKYSLNHPDYIEYRNAYINKDKEWLPEGKSYVNMEIYEKEKR